MRSLAQGGFRTTSWTLLHEAGQSGELATAAVGNLYRRYWGPIRRLFCRLGIDEDEADDLAQNFFLEFFRPTTLGRVQAERGSFRAYLGAAMRRHAASHWRRHYALKRGGGQRPQPLELANRRALDALASTEESFEFDRDWARMAFALAWGNLEREANRYGLSVNEIRACLLQDCGEAQAQRAARLGITVVCLKTRIHRMRLRFRELLREEIASTVLGESAEEIEAELRYLGRLVCAQSSWAA